MIGPDTPATSRAFDATGTGLAVWTPERLLAYANRPFFSAFQLEPTTRVDLSYDEFIEELAQSGELTLGLSVEDWLADRRKYFGIVSETEQPMSDGRTLEIKQQPIDGGGMLTTVHDISKLKRTEFALRRANEAAEESVETKSRFLRAANHDLRQPLATLKILIYNCISEAEAEHRRDLLHAMDISVAIMEDLLGALLQIGQLDAGQMVPRLTTFQLSQLFERLQIQFGHQAAEKGLSLRFVAARCAVVSDKVLLERILSNFVANAIRYTEVGKIVVGCRRAGSSLRIVVADSGRGIDPLHHIRIFDEFYQVEAGRRDKRPGLGLGLNIVSRLATLLRHPVTMRSQLGRGSAFAVTVPIGDVWQSDVEEPEISEMMGGEFAGVPVLLIEDDEVLRSAATKLLERWGVVVTSATSEAEVRQLILQGMKPRLIVADYSLRGQFGTKIVRDIHGWLGCVTPALIVTADVDPKVIDQIKAEGFPVLIKPVSPPRLRVMMHNLLFEPAALAAQAAQPQRRDKP